LIIAVESGAAKSLRTLLDMGANVNATAGADEGDRGMTALMAAAEGGKMETIDLLLAAGADPKILTRQGRSAINFAIETSHDTPAVPLVEKLLAAGVPAAQSCVARAVETNDLALFRLLLKAGGDPNVPTTKHSSNYAGVTAIAMAVQQRANAERMREIRRTMDNEARTDREKADATAMVHELIAAGADVNAPSTSGQPLRIAEVSNDREMIEILRAAGATEEPAPPKRSSSVPPEQSAKPKNEPRKLSASEKGFASTFLKMLFDGNPEWAIFMVEAGIDDVAAAVKTLRKVRAHATSVPVKKAVLTGGTPLDELALVALADAPAWTILIRRLFEIDAEDLRDTPADAAALSKQLKTRAATFMGEDTSSAMGFELFDAGEQVETIHWSGNAVTTFQSTRRDDPRDWPADDFHIADRIFAELGVRLPCCFPDAEDSDIAYLAADAKTAKRVTRCDLITWGQ
jgi:ankyrin repeat protein